MFMCFRAHKDTFGDTSQKVTNQPGKCIEERLGYLPRPLTKDKWRVGEEGMGAAVLGTPPLDFTVKYVMS